MFNPLKRLREYARARTVFMDPHYAAYAKNRLALTYAFVCWNMFGLIVYAIAKEKLPKMEDSRDFAKLYGVKDAKVIRMSGFNVVEEFDVKVTDEEIREYKDVIGKPEEKRLYDEKSEQKRREEDEARKEKQKQKQQQES